MTSKTRTSRSASLPRWADMRAGWQAWFPISWRAGMPRLLIVGSLGSAVVSWIILAGLSPIVVTREVLWVLLGFNAAFMLPLIALVVRRYCLLWFAQRRGVIGAQLHNRMVSLFAIVALLPAILLGSMALVTLDRGLDSWFGERSERLLRNTTEIANIYLSEHQEVLRRDAQAMAMDLNAAWSRTPQDKTSLREFLEAQTALRALQMSAVLGEDTKPLLATSLWLGDQSILPPPVAFTTARQGSPVLLTLMDAAQLRMLVWLEQAQAYLYVARPIDPRALNLMRGVEFITEQHAHLQGERRDVQIAFALIYLGVGIAILLSAIWLGMVVANRLVLPIMSLMAATDKVAQGRLSGNLSLVAGGDDMKRLGDSFNNMMAQLKAQRKDLDERHQFTEMVLSGVSSGVLGLNAAGDIVHANVLGARLLGQTQKQIIGQPLADVSPPLAALLKDMPYNGARASKDMTLSVGPDTQRQVRVQLVRTDSAREPIRVITMDDLTDLISAQRIAAWADIARRIAHEIKNPLTPIQLSAERLANKYGSKLAQQDVFHQCIQTIINHVQDIGRMVDEFASFARMPKAVMRPFRGADVVHQAVFLQRVTHPDIHYELSVSDDTHLVGDARQFNQALTNVLKNAAESIRAKPDPMPKECIRVGVRATKTQLIVSVSDTGTGFPAQRRHDLVEPYTSTRAQGTGLGLAIVKKVIEDHGGQLLLGKARWGSKRYGAKVTMRFARTQPQKASI